MPPVFPSLSPAFMTELTARSVFVLDVFPDVSRLISSTGDVETTAPGEQPATTLFRWFHPRERPSIFNRDSCYVYMRDIAHSRIEDGSFAWCPLKLYGDASIKGLHANGRMCRVWLYYAEWRHCYFRWIFELECCIAAVRCFWSINNWEEPWNLKNLWNGGSAIFV